MRERIESKHVTKEIKSQMPVISPEIIKERGCTFCPYYLGSYEKQPRCMMKNCAWDDENERFHPILRRLIPFYKEKMGIDSYIKAIDFSNCIGSVFTRYGKMFQVNEVEGSVLSWCASRESNMLEIDPTELFRGLQ